MHWTGRAPEASASSPAAPSARSCPRPTTALAGLLLGMVLAIGACTVVPPDVEPPIGTATIGPDAGTVTVVPGVPHSGLMLREVGEPAGVGDVVLLLRAPEATPSEAVDGVRTLTWQYATDVLGEPTEPVVAAGPEGGFFEVLGDGSVLVLDADGRAVAAAAPPSASGARARWDVGQPDLLRLSVVGSRGGAGTGGTVGSAEGAPGSSDGVVQVSVTLSDRALASATWGEREGGRSLAVEPTDWTRHAGEAAVELLWAQVVAAEPEADTSGMHDQLVCHALGAPDKATWNLEPWRPDVGLLGVLAAACNPT